jgi:hypothetical protein
MPDTTDLCTLYRALSGCGIFPDSFFSFYGRCYGSIVPEHQHLFRHRHFFLEKLVEALESLVDSPFHIGLHHAVTVLDRHENSL